jgi:hypothetical protein
MLAAGTSVLAAPDIICAELAMAAEAISAYVTSPVAVKALVTVSEETLGAEDNTIDPVPVTELAKVTPP